MGNAAVCTGEGSGATQSGEWGAVSNDEARSKAVGGAGVIDGSKTVGAFVATLFVTTLSFVSTLSGSPAMAAGSRGDAGCSGSDSAGGGS
jgi:hypothetical protein